MRVRGPRGVTTWRRRYALVPLLLAAVGVPALLWAPAEDEVCAHALSLIPPDHPVKPTTALCLRTLQTQAMVEGPWAHAAHRRCYVAAPSMYELHDCGGELAHLPE